MTMKILKDQLNFYRKQKFMKNKENQDCLHDLFQFQTILKNRNIFEAILNSKLNSLKTPFQFENFIISLHLRQIQILTQNIHGSKTLQNYKHVPETKVAILQKKILTAKCC